MSFSVGCDRCGLEYSGRRPFAQRRNTASPRFAALLWEIGRWLRTARRSLGEADYEQHSLQDYLDEHGYSHRFRRHFLVPLTSALWSTAPGRRARVPGGVRDPLLRQPRHARVGTLLVADGARRRRHVRPGGCRIGSGPRLRLGLGARSLRRDPDGVELTTDDGERHRFDQVVVATHADQALALLEDPSDDERRLLGAFGYTRNDAVLHTDERLLPRARSARASWNYRLGDDGRPTVTYSLNRLQALSGETEYCVTLNEDVADEHVIRRLVYEHPLYTVDSLRAQQELPALSGKRHTWYAGAHHGNGFHEDGLASGVRVAAELGVSW